ncbi:DEAD/DEAH box helicase [Corynebacterium sp. 4HC-13]|uniref:ATP-dependent DNA helicase n=1 Tax=Corynebacterium anserum TaxID=2684406 RepID=UPI00163A5B4E|nr:ATP-dependent DNA helicase [Corynebacterium anserum]MBC2681034.1 DEAD/DEAH box helicase [Corynebacterium anserum]
MNRTQQLLSLAVDSLNGTPRAGQQKMADAVSAAMAEEKHLAVQAGTGTGKSLAYLIPAINQAMHGNLPVIVSTATIALQRQLVERDLPRLAQALEDELPRPLESAILKGRNNYLCLNKIHGATVEAANESGMNPEEEALLSSSEVSRTGAQVKRLYEWANETDDGDRDNLDKGVSDQAWRQVSVASRECIGATRCPFGEQCFAERARARAAQADIVVTNHALLAIDAMADAPILPEHETVVIDEAHELVPRITSAATAELSPTAVAILAKRANKIGSKDTGVELEEAGDAWSQALDSAIAHSAPAGTPGSVIGRWTEVPAGLVTPLSALRDAAWKVNRAISSIPAGEFANDPAQAAERQSVIAATEELHDTAQRVLDASSANAAERPDDLLGEDVVWLSSDSSRKQIFVAPLSVADLLRQRLFSNSTVILTSATLALGGRFNAMMAQWGMPSHATTLDVGTPFDSKTHGILYVATHLPKPGRDGLSAEAIDETARLINAAGGRTLGLFSSRRAAEEMADELRGVVPYDILLQGEDSLSSLVEQFRDNPSTCLFGTLGLWQGVDVPGSSLSLVVIDRLPFPRPDDPLMKARQEAAVKAGRNGFMEVSATHAALLLAQGGGRLLRSVDDRGMVAVLDQRLATARYGSFLRASMPDFWETSSQSTALAALRRLAKTAVD